MQERAAPRPHYTSAPRGGRSPASLSYHQQLEEQSRHGTAPPLTVQHRPAKLGLRNRQKIFDTGHGGRGVGAAPDAALRGLRRLLGQDPLLGRHLGRAWAVVVVVVLGEGLLRGAVAAMGAGHPLLVAVLPGRARSRGVAPPVVARAAPRPASSMGTRHVRAVAPPVQEVHVFAEVGT